MNTTRLRLLRLLVGCVVVASVVSLTPSPAMACSCAGGSLAEYSDIYELVFTGRQIERDASNASEDNGVRLVFAVDRVYVGEEITTPVEIFTSADGGACGAAFPNNAESTVLAAEWNGEMSTNLCDQVFDAGPSKLEAIYGAGYVPASAPLPEAGGSAVTFELLIPLLLLGVVGIGVGRYIRGR